MSSLSRGIRWVIDIFYISPIARFIPISTFRYVACGVANYLLLDPLLYFLIYNYVVGHDHYDLGFVVISAHILAMILLFPITLLMGFWLNRNVAFEATQQRAREQMAKYILSIVGSLVISYLLMKLLIEVCGLWPTPSKALSSLLTATYSYIAARYFTFKKR